MTDTPRPEAVSMVAKVTGDGPIAMPKAEANALRAMLRGLLQELIVAQGVNRVMVEALYRQGFQLTHVEHDDGTVSYNLQNAPQDSPTVN